MNCDQQPALSIFAVGRIGLGVLALVTAPQIEGVWLGFGEPLITDL